MYKRQDKYGTKLVAQAVTSEFSANVPNQDSPLVINEEQSTDRGTNTALINAVVKKS